MTTSLSKNSVRNNQVINDFGQKIGGAHKDRIREAVSQLQGVYVSDLLLKPLSKVAKLPDLRALYLAGSISEITARRARYYWDCIGTKPGSSYPSRLQRWAGRAAALIQNVVDVLACGVPDESQIFELQEGVNPSQSWELFREEMTAANWPEDEYKRGAYFVGHHWRNPERYSIHTEKVSYSTAFDTVADAVAAIRAKVDKNTTKATQKFSMYKTSAGVYYIAPKGKSGIKLAEFTNQAEAWEFYRDTENLGKIYNELRKFQSERRDWNRPRIGEDWRQGRDMSPESFAEVFPFRGVEFGNWVNQTERAACLNEAADALQDLAAVIGIRPEAVALGGSLAWAFGSRGVGKALAHYEPARRVVNLTKKKGNGCVAHEWFHAIDNYIMINAGNPSLMAVSDSSYKDAEKSPIFDAAKALKNALLKSDLYTRSRRIDAFRSAKYWSTVTEMAARAFEAVIYYKLESAGMCNDYLVNFKPSDEWNRPECYPYPTKDEAAQLSPLFDEFISAAFSEAERAPMVEPSAGLLPEDEPVPDVAASEPMNAEEDEAPTPSDGVQDADYGDSQKSQDSVRPEVEALREQARRAGTWTSFNPEGLGDSLISELENSLQSFESKLPEEIRAEKVAAYISKWREWLAARSRCISSAITGPARFPVARAEKLWNYERNAWKRLEDWAEKVVRRCNAEQRLKGWDEVERLTAKAEKLERLQELMKKANKVVRSKASDIEKLDELIAMGFSEETANEIMTPDNIGRIGFAPFQLTNNLAKIKDTRAKIARHEALASKEDHSVEYEWGTLEFCYSDERYRLHFPGKPSPEILTFLKSHGWKWSRANSAWQRQITSDSHYNLKQFIKNFGGKVEPSPEASSPSDDSHQVTEDTTTDSTTPSDGSQPDTEETKSEAQTPSEGSTGAAYGDSEKSQNPDATTVEGVEVVGYSEKALAIFGNTRPFADKLKAIGAKFNRALTYNGERRAGWIISRRKADDLAAILGAHSDSPTPSDDSHQDTEETPTDSTTPSDGGQVAPYGEPEKSQNQEADEWVRTAETQAINSALVVVPAQVMRDFGFVDDSGEIVTNTGSAAILHPSLGFVCMPDDGGIPYNPVGGAEALAETLQAGGFLNFDGFRFVWPIDHDADTMRRVLEAYGNPEKSQKWDRINQ